MSAKKTVVITGGTGALGQAVTQAFVRAGWKAIVSFKSAGEATALSGALGDHADALTLVEADVLDPDSVKAFAASVSEVSGTVDALVNLIGGFAGGHFLTDTAVNEWDRMFDLNVKSAFLASRVMIPLMRENGGSIVVIGSQMGENPAGKFVAYSVAKASVLAFMKALSAELKEFGIRVNCVLPGTMDTPANRSAMPNADTSAWVTTSAVAQAILHFCSEESKDITGAAVPVYGMG